MIAQVHAESNGTYGARRVHAELRLGRGIIVGHNAVEMLMRRAGFTGLPGSRRPRRRHETPTAEDLVDRQFARSTPDQLWVTDITEHPTREGKIYCAVVLDAFSRRVVGWSKLARTLGIERRVPTLAAGRSADVMPFLGIDPLPLLPHHGSGLVVWDFGTPTPPASETPNRAGDDPHGKLADVPQALAFVAAFINNGTIIDVCNNQPCHTP